MPDASPPLLSPYARSLGIALCDEGGAGDAIVSVAYGRETVGRPGVFHGGAMAGLLEAAGYVALRRALRDNAADAELKPINMTVQYLSAATAQPGFAMARVTKLGRRTANIAIEAWQDDRERLVATAIMNILIARTG
ncbi:MAG: PaaI family thioesterase [Parerythrobacter sp.]